MDVVDLKRGKGTIRLEKSADVVALRPTSQASVDEALAVGAAGAEAAGTGVTLGGFELVRVGERQHMERLLDDLRTHYMIDAGTHVFHTPRSDVPYVPTGRIMLRFKPDTTDDQRQRLLDEHRLEIVEARAARGRAGGAVETYIVRITPESPNPLKVAHALQESDVVLVAEPDLASPGRLYQFTIPGDPLAREQWHLRNTGTQFGTTAGLKAGADARVVDAWQTAESLGSPACIVAVIDDGFDLSHPDLAGSAKVVAPWDFSTNSADPSPKRFHPDPRYGDYHGTACAGVAIGNANGTGIVGAAPGCRFMPVRWGQYLSDDEIEGWFGYVTTQGAWVVSCSWGAAADHYLLSTRQEEAIAQCASEGRNGLGAVIVFAAGNANHDVNDPRAGTVDGFAIHPDVIAVAACNSRDERSAYSNYGREISVCAPSSGPGGRGIFTSDVRGRFRHRGTTYESGYEAGDFTRTFGGTSSAAPLVAGICALVLSVNPALRGADVKDLLQRTARRIGPADAYDADGHSKHFGYGCVNADAAVQEAASGPRPAR